MFRSSSTNYQHFTVTANNFTMSTNFFNRSSTFISFIYTVISIAVRYGLLRGRTDSSQELHDLLEGDGCNARAFYQRYEPTLRDHYQASLGKWCLGEILIPHPRSGSCLFFAIVCSVVARNSVKKGVCERKKRGGVVFSKLCQTSILYAVWLPSHAYLCNFQMYDYCRGVLKNCQPR